MRAGVPVEWLKSPVAVEEIDAWQVERATLTGRPLTELAADWTALKARMLPGDEVWYFESGPESWRQLAGREGYALVRDGDVIEALVTGMN